MQFHLILGEKSLSTSADWQLRVLYGFPLQIIYLHYLYCPPFFQVAMPPFETRPVQILNSSPDSALPITQNIIQNFVVKGDGNAHTSANANCPHQDDNNRSLYFQNWWTPIHIVSMTSAFAFLNNTPVAQWVKRWPADLAVPSSSPTPGEIFSTVNGAQLHTAFNYQPLIFLI